jgi:hypothetical protein
MIYGNASGQRTNATNDADEKSVIIRVHSRLHYIEMMDLAREFHSEEAICTSHRDQEKLDKLAPAAP